MITKEQAFRHRQSPQYCQNNGSLKIEASKYGGFFFAISRTGSCVGMVSALSCGVPWDRPLLFSLQAGPPTLPPCRKIKKNARRDIAIVRYSVIRLFVNRCLFTFL